MTLKNLLTSTENPTLTLPCRTACSLRSVICILIFSICFLSGLNSYSQEPLVYKESSDIYTNSDLTAVIQPNQAFLLMTKKPSGGITTSTVFTLNDLLSQRYNINFSDFSVHSSYGRLTPAQDNSAQKVLAIIDDTYYYGENHFTIDANILPQLTPQLSNLGLGTIAQRSAYISFLNSQLNVNPVDFRTYLQPWIILGLVIAILIPAWYLCRRFLRG